MFGKGFEALEQQDQSYEGIDFDEQMISEDISFESMEEASVIFQDNHAVFCTLLYMDAMVSEEGVAALERPEFASVVTELKLSEVSEEGLGDAIRDAITKFSRKMTKIMTWFEDKFKEWTDESYDGLKALAKFKKEGKMRLMGDKGFDDRKVRSFSKKDLEEIIKALQTLIKELPMNVSMGSLNDPKSTDKLVQPLGYTVERMKTLNKDFVFLSVKKGRGLPDNKKGTFKDLGISKGDLENYIDQMYDILDNYSGFYKLLGKAINVYEDEADKVEKAMAKGEDKDDIVTMKHKLHQFNHSVYFIRDLAMVQYQVTRKVSKQIRGFIKPYLK